MKHLPLDQLTAELEKILPELPLGDCDLCDQKGVPVFVLHNCDNPVLTKSVCFVCLKGGANPLTPEQLN